MVARGLELVAPRERALRAGDVTLSELRERQVVDEGVVLREVVRAHARGRFRLRELSELIGDDGRTDVRGAAVVIVLVGLHEARERVVAPTLTEEGHPFAQEIGGLGTVLDPR